MSDGQMTLGDVLAQHGIDQAVNAASVDWLSAARTHLEALAYLGALFTSEDILDAVERQGLTTRDTRALGGVLRKAQRDGLIRPVGWETAQRPTRHSAPVRRWAGAGGV